VKTTKTEKREEGKGLEGNAIETGRRRLKLVNKGLKAPTRTKRTPKLHGELTSGNDAKTDRGEGTT